MSIKIPLKKAFEENSMPITLEVKDNKVVWIIYAHTNSIRDDVELITSDLDPALLFKEIVIKEKTTYQELPLSSIMQHAQSELRRILKGEYLNGGELRTAA